MMFTTELRLTGVMAVLMVGGVAAQSTISSSSPTPTGSVMTHVIQVGDAQGTLKFFPEKVKANKGDLIQFQFFPKAHSVAQSSFDQPCQPIENSAPSTKGFWSGMMPVDMANRTMPLFTIPVTDDTKPIWFYCATGKHCQGGMVGVVNEPTDKTLETYKEKAKVVAQAGVPAGAASGGAGTGRGSLGGSSNTTATPIGAPRPSETSDSGASGVGITRYTVITIALGSMVAIFM